MSLRKTRTATAELNVPWAKLISKTKGLPDYQISDDTVTIGRKATNTLVINEQSLSSSHCTIYKKGDKIILKDLSSNGTYHNNNKIGQGNQVELEHLNEIWLLHPSRVPIQKSVGYVFSIYSKQKQEDEKKEKIIEIQKQKLQKQKKENEKQDSASKEQLKRKVEELEELEGRLKRMNEEQMQKLAEEKKKAESEKQAMDKILKDQITCSLCLEIMHVPVAVHPCNHHFCGGCLSLLVKSKQQNCVECRKKINTAQRDANFNVLIQQYLKTHPDDKRSKEETDDLDKNNIFTFDATDYQEAVHGKKKTVAPVPVVRAARGRAVRGRAARRGSDLSASSDSDDGAGRCRQCNVTRNGFQCGPGQIHANCHTCGKSIANRSDPALKQCCVLCSQFYCNLYYPPCRPVGVKLDTVDGHGMKSRITVQNFRGNTYEYSYFSDFIRSKKYTPHQFYQILATKYLDTNLFRFLYDRKIMKIPPIASRDVPLTRESAICTMCWSDVWFQIVLRYRMQINNQLPIEVKNRMPCYYGINCSTMGHKPDHAKKLNHCEFQTKF